MTDPVTLAATVWIFFQLFLIFTLAVLLFLAVVVCWEPVTRQFARWFRR